MIALPLHHRWATKKDDVVMAELVNFAGDGLPFYLWCQQASSKDAAWAIGRERARRDNGAFSYRNTVLRECGGKVAAALIGYPIADHIEINDYSDMPAMFVPMQMLEDQAPGTWYVNVLATYPEHRSRGFGRQLLAIAEQLAGAYNKRGLSIIVADSNEDARRLYERIGFREQARREMVKEQWDNPGEEWILMTKDLN